MHVHVDAWGSSILDHTKARTYHRHLSYKPAAVLVVINKDTQGVILTVKVVVSSYSQSAMEWNGQVITKDSPSILILVTKRIVGLTGWYEIARVRQTFT